MPSLPRTLSLLPGLRPASLWLLVLAMLLLAPGLGMRDPAPPDEPRFVLAAKAMWDTGDWLLPRRGSEVYADKPPPFMWMQAASFGLARDWRVAFLLPSLLAALVTLWMVQDLGGRLWNARSGRMAALALLVTLQFGLQARRAQIDMVLVAFTTVSLWALVRHLLLDRRRWLACVAGFAAGLGTVTKGVGFLPLLALVPWRMLPAGRRGDGSLHAGWMAAGFGGGCLVWLGPLLLVASSSGGALDGYLDEILLRQTAGRLVEPWHHLRPPWYYLQVIATLWLPGALLLPWLLPAWWRRLRRGDPRMIVLLGWCLLVLAFFSASAGKREVYILPALPAACLAAAPLLAALLRRLAVQRVLRAYVVAMGVGLLVPGLIGSADLGGVAGRLADERGMDAGDVGALALSLVGAGSAVLLSAVLAWRRVGLLVLAATAAAWIGYGCGVAPALDASSSARSLMQQVAARIGPQAELGLVAWREQVLLQAPAGTVEFGFSRPWDEQWRSASQWLSVAPQRRWILVLDEALGPCVERSMAIRAGRSNRRDWLLVPGTAWTAGPCAAAASQASTPSSARQLAPARFAGASTGKT